MRFKNYFVSISAILICVFLIFGLASVSATYDEGDNDNIRFDFDEKNPKPGENYELSVVIINNGSKEISVIAELWENTGKMRKVDNERIENLPGGENKSISLCHRAPQKGEYLVRVYSGEIENTKPTPGGGDSSGSMEFGSAEDSEGVPFLGISWLVLLGMIPPILIVFAGGLYLGDRWSGGGESIYRTPPASVEREKVEKSKNKAVNALENMETVLSEAQEVGADTSREEKISDEAVDFLEKAEEKRDEARLDSAYAYSRGAYLLGDIVSGFLEDKKDRVKKEKKRARKAQAEAKEDIKSAEEAIEDVRRNLDEAESRGINADPAKSLIELSSEIMESTSEAEKSEIYRFKAELAKKIAKHAKDSLQSSISDQEGQIERTEKRIEKAKEALDEVDDLIEKRRDDFDTLVPEYWLQVAEEIQEISEDKDMNPEVREAMADSTVRICNWIEGMFERRDLRSRMKEEESGGIIER